MGVVTAASSLIDALVKKNPDEYKGCVSLAVSRLSRVSLIRLDQNWRIFAIWRKKSCLSLFCNDEAGLNLVIMFNILEGERTLIILLELSEP